MSENRFEMMKAFVKNWRHREIHDIAAKGGINKAERLSILAAMKGERVKIVKATRAFKRSKGKI